MNTEQTTTDTNPFISVMEAAAILKVQQKTIYRMIEREQIPAKRVGRRYLIPRSWLTDLIGEA